MSRFSKALVDIVLMITVFFFTKCLNAQTYNEHEFVDLGLPSGTLWATCNVGATNPEGFGYYFAWGETATKSHYDWDSYKYAKSFYTVTKYCNKSEYGHNGFTDYLTVLQPKDDVASVNWGSDWCIPTNEQWEELENNTISQWTMLYGVQGRLFIASNGNCLFLPAAGIRMTDSEFCYVGHGYYWSSSLDTNYPFYALFFGFASGYYNSGNSGFYRSTGFSIRPVRSAR